MTLKYVLSRLLAATSVAACLAVAGAMTVTSFNTDVTYAQTTKKKKAAKKPAAQPAATEKPADPAAEAPADAAAADAKAGDKKKVSSWVKLCEKAPIKKDDPPVEICISHHERLDQNSGAPIVSAAMRNVEGQAKPRFLITVPLGMALPPGAQMKIDEQKDATQLRYTFCLPNGCTAEVDAEPALVEALSVGKVLTIATINLAGEQIGFQVPLNGFKETYEGKPVETSKFINARKQLVMRIREKLMTRIKAEQEKKKQTGAAEGTPEPGTAQQ